MKPSAIVSLSAEAVRLLVKDHGAVLMKLSTEDEALTHEALERRVRAFSREITVELKLGGPGARGDLAFGKALGLRHFIAPMVESAYAMEDYLAGTREVFGWNARGLFLGVNIETVTAARNIREILRKDADKCIKLVTVGRSDLSKSLGVGVDDRKVMIRARKIVEMAKQRDYLTSVGGGVEPGNVMLTVSACAPAFVNTRNFAFPARRRGLPDSIRAALLAEILLTRLDESPLSLSRRKSLWKRTGDPDELTGIPALGRMLSLLERAGLRPSRRKTPC